MINVIGNYTYKVFMKKTDKKSIKTKYISTVEEELKIFTVVRKIIRPPTVYDKNLNEINFSGFFHFFFAHYEVQT